MSKYEIVSEKQSTTYRYGLAPVLDGHRSLEEYAGAYEGIGIDDACVSNSSTGLALFFTVYHPHSDADIMAFEDYLARYYQRTAP